MAQNIDLRVQSTPPTTPTSSSVVSLYVNSTSGVVAQNSAGGLQWIGGQLTGTLALSAMKSGGLQTLGTGLNSVIFSAHTGAGISTGLGLPSFFAPFLGSDGLVYGAPMYPLK